MTNDELWQEVTKDIKPIKKNKYNTEKKPVELKEIKPSLNIEQISHGQFLPELEVGETNNIDRNTARRFKRGEFSIEKRLDLHGFYEDEAFEKVKSFIKNSYQQGLRCVLIISGKGAVLHQRLPQWLNGEVRALILSYTYAQPKDGGQGAIYVFLKRKR